MHCEDEIHLFTATKVWDNAEDEGQIQTKPGATA